MIKPNYQIGDKVHIEYLITDIGDDCLRLEREYYCTPGSKRTEFVLFENPAIVKHIPKPYEPKVGDIFIGVLSKREYTICGFDNNTVWVKYLSDSKNSFFIYNTLTLLEITNTEGYQFKNS